MREPSGETTTPTSPQAARTPEAARPDAEQPEAEREARRTAATWRRLSDSVRPAAHSAYRLLWLGRSTSSLGDAVAGIAFVFAVLRAGGTATDVGLVEGTGTLALVLFLLVGGVWADRLPRQYVMLAADAVHAVVEAVLAALLLTGHARVWELGAGAFLHGTASAFFGSASTGLVAQTVPAGNCSKPTACSACREACSASPARPSAASSSPRSARGRCWPATR